jgi:hypothetical protein
MALLTFKQAEVTLLLPLQTMVAMLLRGQVLVQLVLKVVNKKLLLPLNKQQKLQQKLQKI